MKKSVEVAIVSATMVGVIGLGVYAWGSIAMGLEGASDKEVAAVSVTPGSHEFDWTSAVGPAQEGKAERERLAAEAEAARIASEQAAAAALAEQATQEAAAPEEEETPEPEPEPSPAPVDDGVPEGAWPLPWIPSADPQNAQGGNWDFSGCTTGATTYNGAPHCVP